MGPCSALGKVVVRDSTGGNLGAISANQEAQGDALILVHSNFCSQSKSAELFHRPKRQCTVVDHRAGEDGHAFANKPTAHSRVQETIATPSDRQDDPWEASAVCDSARRGNEGMCELFEGGQCTP